jgi:hypothetical protein
MPDAVEIDPLTIQAKQLKPLSKLSRRIIIVYRGWHKFEQRHGGPSIVDFDMSDVEGATSFDSRDEVLRALSELYQALAEFDSLAEGEFLQTRVRGSIAYLRALMKPKIDFPKYLLGDRIDFPKYLMDTLGVEPIPFSDQEIEDAHQAISVSLAEFGLSMRAEEKKQFERLLLVDDPAVIKNGIVENKDVWLKRLREVGVPAPNQIPLSVEFTKVDEYWSNWISGSSKKGITLSINLHSRKKYDRGRPLVLCLHEICGHAVQMSLWKDLIAKGAMNAACGLTTVHSPEAFVAEGLAQTVPDLLNDGGWKYSSEFNLSRALSYYTSVILHNAHLMFYEGVSVDRVVEFASDRLPFSDLSTIKYEIRDRAINPLFRSYELSYALGERAIRNLIKGMSVSQKRQFFFEIYAKPLTPKQMQQMGEGIRGRHGLAQRTSSSESSSSSTSGTI